MFEHQREHFFWAVNRSLVYGTSLRIKTERLWLFMQLQIKLFHVVTLVVKIHSVHYVSCTQ